jgi:hypothetical protein
VCTEICCFLVWLLAALKSWSRRRNQTFRMTRRLTVSTWARTKTCLTKPIIYIYMIVASRAWLGWLLHYYLYCPLIDISCLARILLFVYALTWVYICYMIFTWLLNAWVIWLVIEYFDDEYGWGCVSATVGVVLSRRVLLRIKDCGCVDISSNLVSYSHSTLYG